MVPKVGHRFREALGCSLCCDGDSGQRKGLAEGGVGGDAGRQLSRHSPEVTGQEGATEPRAPSCSHVGGRGAGHWGPDSSHHDAPMPSGAPGLAPPSPPTGLRTATPGSAVTVALEMGKPAHKKGPGKGAPGDRPSGTPGPRPQTAACARGRGCREAENVGFSEVRDCPWEVCTFSQGESTSVTARLTLTCRQDSGRAERSREPGGCPPAHAGEMGTRPPG